MSDLTGDAGWDAFDAPLYPCDKDHIRIIKAFFCGMQIPFSVTDEGIIARVSTPIYRPTTMEEQSYEEQQATIAEQAKVIRRLANPTPMSDTQVDPLTSAVEAKARITFAKAALKEKTDE